MESKDHTFLSQHGRRPLVVLILSRAIGCSQTPGYSGLIMQEVVSPFLVILGLSQVAKPAN